jgi:hypothetical protein
LHVAEVRIEDQMVALETRDQLEPVALRHVATLDESIVHCVGQAAHLLGAQVIRDRKAG